jgi:hypothetical protein
MDDQALFIQSQHHLFLVEIPVADPQCAGLQAICLESQGTIKCAGALVFGVDAQVNLQDAALCLTCSSTSRRSPAMPTSFVSMKTPNATCDAVM